MMFPQRIVLFVSGSTLSKTENLEFTVAGLSDHLLVWMCNYVDELSDNGIATAE